MDTLLTAAKRPCSDTASAVRKLPKNDAVSQASSADSVSDLLESFLSISDSSHVGVAFDKIVGSESCDSDQHDLIERALSLGSAILEAAKRAERRRFSAHNAAVWPLPHDITVKVFSMLNTQSVCYAAATCSFFQKCSMDPTCFANIDLTAVVPRVNNDVVSALIQRAGKALRSIKLGVVTGPTPSLDSYQSLVFSGRNLDSSVFSWNEKRSRQGKEPSVLTRTCLASLGGESYAPGAYLKTLHLYNIERMDNSALCVSLSCCPSLLDLEIVGLHVELRHTLESVSKHCPLIERLFFESTKTGRDDGLKYPICDDFVEKCPNMTSLSLRGFKLQDYKARLLVKGFPKLKYVDFSTSYSFTGAFLKNLGSSCGGGLLEFLILRDCMHLRDVEVERLISAVLAGEFRFLKHLDISNREGLATEGGWFHRCYSASFLPIEQLLERRPHFCLLSEFPEGSLAEMDEHLMDSDFEDDLFPMQQSSLTSDESFFISALDFNSDPGSANEDTAAASFGIYEESSDEVELL